MLFRSTRFGDPETQVLVLRLNSDLLSALMASAHGALKNFSLRWSNDVALTVVMAAKGYPGPHVKGTMIKGLVEAAMTEGVEIFHAGTVVTPNGVISTGGRSLTVTALGKSVTEAQARAYEAIDKIQWPDGFCRRDIGWRAVAREQSLGE